MTQHVFVSALVLLGALLPASAVAADDNVECVVRCAHGTECQVETPGKTVTVTAGVERLDACPRARLRKVVLPVRAVPGATGALLEGLVRSTTGVKRFAIGDKQVNQFFAEANPKLFANSSCLGLMPQCAESRDQARTAAVAGKGIATLKFNRIGEPCAIGLPCGSVVRPANDLEIALQGFVQGRLRLAAIGASGGAHDWPVEQGVLRLAAAALAAGTAYTYSLFDGTGKEIAAGGFEVISTKMQADVQADLDRIKAGDDAAAAFERLEILLDSGLLWDASRQR